MPSNPLTPVDRFVAKLLFHDNFTRALFIGDVKEVLIQIIDKGADVNAKPKGILVLSDETPLSLASSKGHLEVVQILLAAGADVNKKNNDIDGWRNPLYGAAEDGYVDTVQCLLDAGADVNSIGGKDRNTALLIAVKEKYLNVVQALLTAGANVNLFNKYGESPLLCASDNGHVEMVQALLGAQTDVNKADNAGQTPLIMASRKGHLEVVRILLKAGADINKITRTNSVLTMDRDALLIACERKHWEIVEILLNAGANVNIQTYYGVTAAHIINEEGKMELLHTCLDAGADLHSGHHGGSNSKLVTTFVTNGNLEKFSLLLNRVADKEIRNIGDNLNFDTLFFEAIFVEDLDILELLFRKFHPKVILDYSKEFGVSSRYDELKIKIDNFEFDYNGASWSTFLPEVFGVRDIPNEVSYPHVEIHKNWSYKKSKLEKIAQKIINERTSYINVLRQINLDNFTQVNCENMRKYKAIFYIEFKDPLIIMRERLDILTFGSKGFSPEQPISKHIYEYL